MDLKKRQIKLFLISGLARSGKGEVAKIISDHYNNSIIISFGHYIKDYAKRVSDWDGSEDSKPRDLLQQLGIELIKNKIDNRLFINRILEDIKVFSYFYDVIIVDDVRLLDEFETLKKHYPNSISIKVTRNNYDSGLTTRQKTHLTETDLDNINSDYIINNENYDKLKQEVENILKGV